MSLDYDTEADTDTQTYSEEQRAKFKEILENAKVIDRNKTVELMNQLNNLIINIDANNKNPPSSGGKKKVKPDKSAINGKKEILGKQRCIYKKAGDRKEYVKYKGALITVKDYKKVMKDITVKRNKK